MGAASVSHGVRRTLTRAALLLGVLGIAAFGVLGGFAAVLVAQAMRELPTPQAIRAGALVADITMRDRNGLALHAERTGDDHRVVVPFDAISPSIRNAVVAIEDARFWTRTTGVDVRGILRAGKATVLDGSAQGGSTIPQQLLKLTLLGGRPTMLRKIEEWMLVRRYEALLTKEDLLDLYLNAGFFGSGRAGVEAASRNFFGKSAREVTAEEAALLAALLKAPSDLSPFCNAERARARQQLVLRRMTEEDMLPPVDARDTAIAFRMADDTARESTAFVDVALHSGDFRSGDTVVTTLDARVQHAAVAALSERLARYARQRGEHRGPRFVLPAGERVAWRSALVALRTALRSWGTGRDGALIYDFRSLPAPGSAKRLCEHGATIFRHAEPNGFASGIVIEQTSDRVTLDLGDYTATLDATAVAWTKQTLANVVPLGAVVDVELPAELPSLTGGSTPLCDPRAPQRAKPDCSAPAPLSVTLIPRPRAEGAVVALDPRTHEVRALVGGVEQRRAAFDRARSAARSIGSTVKPLTFAVAAGLGTLGVFDTVADVPVRYVDPWSGGVWAPENWYDGHKEDLLAFQALVYSVNTVAVHTAFAVGIDRLRTFAAFMSPIVAVPREPAIALGAFPRTPLELANAYATIASGGIARALAYVQEVERSGEKYPLARDAPRQALDPQFAQLADWLLRQPVEDPSGTAHALDALGLGIRGKTGTTNDAHDAWFVGYTPELLVVVWIGYDAPRSLAFGNRAEGGSTLAAPVAQDVFRAAKEEGRIAAAPPPVLPIAQVPIFGTDAPQSIRDVFAEEER